tara:strand:- start:75 stop:260 length:186 start_codon:yes stop_codon:yes gene_type:complete
MKIDKNGIEEIHNTIETPLVSLASKLSKRKQLTPDLSEIVTFILSNIQKLEDQSSQWEIID